MAGVIFFRFNAKNWQLLCKLAIYCVNFGVNLFSKNFARVKKMTNMRYAYPFFDQNTIIIQSFWSGLPLSALILSVPRAIFGRVLQIGMIDLLRQHYHQLQTRNCVFVPFVCFRSFQNRMDVMKTKIFIFKWKYVVVKFRTVSPVWSKNFYVGSLRVFVCLYVCAICGRVLRNWMGVIELVCQQYLRLQTRNDDYPS